MAGISSEAAKGIVYPTNKKKYNGIEETRDLGLNQYDAQLRVLDPQIAVWWQVDPETEKMEMWSPYTSNYDNPILYKDPLGNEPECCGGLLGALADIGDKISISVIGVAVGALNVLSGGAVSTNPLGYRDKLLSGPDRESYDMAVFIVQVASMMPVPAGGARKVPGANPEFVTPGGAKVKVETNLPEVPSTNRVQSNSNSSTGKSSEPPPTVSQKPLSSVKKAVAEAQGKVGGSLPKGKAGKFGSPQRGDTKTGYRLDPGHPGKPPGHPEAGPHVNWWDYSSGKRNGNNSGAIPIQ